MIRGMGWWIVLSTLKSARVESVQTVGWSFPIPHHVNLGNPPGYQSA